MTRNLILILTISTVCFFTCCKKEHVSKDFCDCADSQATYIIDTTTVTIPNLFTPNGDCCNDAWIIKNIDKFPDCKIKVTRPGLLGGTIFESTSGNQYWDGSINNDSKRFLKEGKYKYEITVNGQTITGYVCIFHGDTEPKNIDCLKNCVTTDLNDPIIK